MSINDLGRSRKVYPFFRNPTVPPTIVDDLTVTDVITTTYQAGYDQLVRVDPTGGGFTVTLPSAAGKNGKTVIVKNVTGSTNQVTVAAQSPETIDNSSSYSIDSSTEAVMVFSDGTNWLIGYTNVQQPGNVSGIDTQIQFNDGGLSFGADSGLTYIKSTQTLNAVKVIISDSISQGNSTTVSGSYSFAGGIGTIASGSGQTVFGGYNKRNNNTSLFVIGTGTGDADASRRDVVRIEQGVSVGFDRLEITGSLAQGNSNNIATGQYSHAEGNGTTASGIRSHAEGNNTTASGQFSHAEGASSSASNNGAHAEGLTTTASGIYSHSEGALTNATAQYSHAEGNGTTASGNQSHAEGSGTTASGNQSHAEGGGTTSSGSRSHAEGENTLALGVGSHAEGLFTTGSANYSHAQGQNTVAIGTYSFAGGIYTIASGSGQTVLGKYNLRNNNISLFAVGNGTGDADVSRSDVFRVNQAQVEVTGSLAVTGDITIEGGNIRESGGGVAISLPGSQNVTVGNILRVNGDAIRNSNGTTSISFPSPTANGDVTVTGDLRINGDDIKGSGGIAALTLSDANVYVSGNLYVGDGTGTHSAKGDLILRPAPGFASDITTTSTTANIFNDTATTVNIGGGATTGVNIGNAGGLTKITGGLSLNGIKNLSFAETGNETYTIVDGEVLLYFSSALTSGTKDVVLPSAASNIGRVVIVKITAGDSGATKRVVRSGTDTIDGSSATTITLSTTTTSNIKTSVTLMAIASGRWVIISYTNSITVT